MLTRRENLLIRPWQERRYIQHRKKVNAALPAIDNNSPPFRDHVCCKLKKIQKQSERCTQIISDNFTLLQHLCSIMRTTRVDHIWDEPPPNFLRRVGIYAIKTPENEDAVQETSDSLPPRTRKDKCLACSPQRYKLKELSDVRRPYTPPKARISRKEEALPDWESQFHSRCDEDRLEFRGKTWKKPSDEEAEKRSSSRTSVKRWTKSPGPKPRSPLEDENQRIVLTRGGLSVAVKFPAHTGVVYSSPKETKVIQKNFCECKSFPPVRMNQTPRKLKSTSVPDTSDQS